MSDEYRVLQYDEMQDNLQKINERDGLDQRAWPRPLRRDLSKSTVYAPVRHTRGI